MASAEHGFEKGKNVWVLKCYTYLPSTDICRFHRSIDFIIRSLVNLFHWSCVTEFNGTETGVDLKDSTSG